MKTIVITSFVFVLSLALISCGKSAHDEHQHDNLAGDSAAAEGGDVLLEEVNKAHDEAMARMGEIRKLRTQLDEKVALPDVTEEKKAELQAAILQLDSAYSGMMDWMHKFHPNDDTLSDEAYHEYLETELEKIKKVHSSISDAIEKAKEY